MGERVAVVVGGSVAGLACAHAAAGAGWKAVVLEKAAGPAAGGGTGAGLGLDAQSMETLARWIPGWGLDAATLPLAVDLVTVLSDSTPNKLVCPLPWLMGTLVGGCFALLLLPQNRATDSETKAGRTLTRDEGFGFRAAHWGELHRRLHEALPPVVTVLWGHQFLSFEVSDDDDKHGVVATARVLATGETVEVVGDLLVAADGCMSSIRRRFLPDLKLR
jgi:2-polyprenyl-6-methoxyphenol hydroxylase-like FAD-dependent oxidoreductase